MQNSIEKSRVKINEHLFWFTILELNSADIYQLRTGTDMGTPYTHDVVIFVCAMILLSKDNLNLPMSFFSSLCLVASFSHPSCYHTHNLAALRWFLFVYFHRSQIGSPAINQTFILTILAGKNCVLLNSVQE